MLSTSLNRIFNVANYIRQDYSRDNALGQGTSPLWHVVEEVAFGSFQGQPCIKSCDFAHV